MSQDNEYSLFEDIEYSVFQDSEYNEYLFQDTECVVCLFQDPHVTGAVCISSRQCKAGVALSGGNGEHTLSGHLLSKLSDGHLIHNYLFYKVNIDLLIISFININFIKYTFSPFLFKKNKTFCMHYCNETPPKKPNSSRDKKRRHLFSMEVCTSLLGMKVLFKSERAFFITVI